MEQELHEIRQSLRQYSDARVESAEVVDGRIEVTCKLVPDGDEIVALATNGIGGAGGGLVRVPSAGETVVVSMQDGDPTQARIIGYAPTEGMKVPEGLESGITYMVAPDGERLVISATAEIEVTADGAKLSLVSKNADVDVSSEGGKVNAGSPNASTSLSLAPKVAQNLSSIVNTFNAHQHIYIAPLLPIAPVVTITPTTPMSPPTDTATKNLKGD